MPQKLTVATPSAAVEKMLPDWELAQALLGGTRSMRDAGEKYLPKWPKEMQESYNARLNVSVLFPAYQRTISTLAAKPFSKAIVVGDDVPQAVQDVLQDVDMQGRNLDRFAADVMETIAGYGLSGILVDFPDATEVPTTEAGARTQAAEQQAGLRPYWVEIKPQQIVGWRAAFESGAWVFRMLRLMECVEEDAGDFGTTEVEQVRVLEPSKWTTYRLQKTTAGEEWLLHREGATTLSFVPFIPCYGRRDGFMASRAPLIELAHMNIAHWQSASDQQNILHVARVPLLVAKNVHDPMDVGTGAVTPWELSIGAGAAVRITGQDAELKYVEHGGQAIGAGVTDLASLEDRMRQAGAELLVVGQGQKTRIEAGADNEVATCALQRMTLAFEDALDVALDYTAQWLGLGVGAGGHVELFKDFGAANLAEASAQLLLDANMAGKISDETLHSEFLRRGILSADNGWQDEAERLQGQGPSLGVMVDPAAPVAALAAPDQSALREAIPLDLSPIVAAITAGIEGLRTAMPQPMDLPALLAAIQPQPAGAITVNAPPPDMSGIAAAMQTFGAALSAVQPGQVHVTTPATPVDSGMLVGAVGAMVQAVSTSSEAMTVAAAAMQKAVADMPAAVAAAAPKDITAQVNMPKRTATGTFTFDANGDVAGVMLTDN